MCSFGDTTRVIFEQQHLPWKSSRQVYYNSTSLVPIADLTVADVYLENTQYQQFANSGDKAVPFHHFPEMEPYIVDDEYKQWINETDFR
ncbi:hypothetical protein CEXT_728281 [Caerostris extrusa]|uniref:Uncharacterized protein n=1 Tax=Caerostris extrusa TaxID=172846 RepID=A0AAV4MK84_CAEEX|nr:hypothetical protein CEXT_728281 [Caerostris extrusa]